MLKLLTMWITTNCGKFFKRWEYKRHLNCLLRNLYAGQEVTVRTRHGTMDWFQIGKGVCQGYILSPCLFNLYAENVMWNARIDESQAGIKISGRNNNHLRYADDITLMAESEEELKSLFKKVKEESEKAGWKLTFKNQRSWLWFYHFMANGQGKCGNSVRFHFLGLQNLHRRWLQAQN